MSNLFALRMPPLFSALLLAAAASATATTAATPTRPHIIFMLADDWGSYDATYRQKELGRTPDLQTPSIDALGASGIRFGNYYVQPICTPTRSGLLTGRYSIHTGSEHILFGAFEDSCLPVDLPLMPAAFKKLGYQTHAIGKWHLGYVNDTCAPWSRSFDSYVGYLNGNAGYYCNAVDFHECKVAAAAGSGGSYEEVGGRMALGPYAIGVAGGAVQRGLSYDKAVELCDAAEQGCFGFTFNNSTTTFKRSTAVNKTASADGWTSALSKAAHPASCDWDQYAACSYDYEGTYSTHAYTRRAQDLIEGWRPGDDSLFVYLAWQAVHEPLDVPDRYLAPFTSAIQDPSRRIYAGMLAALDEGIGNITQTLRETGLYNNSVLVLSNDNGK